MKNILLNLTKNNNIRFSIILLVALFLLVGVRKNYLDNNLTRYHDDEYHTVLLAIKSIKTGHVDNFRALEGGRWMYRLFYPGALIKMSQKMGGNTAISGWSRVGHKYILENYLNKDISAHEVKQRLEKDPNLRDFFYYLRLQSILFVFVCMIPLLFYCYKHKYYFALVFLIVFPSLNSQLSNEQGYAYIEPLLLGFISIVISLFLYLFQKRKISSFMMIFIGFVSAFIISVKFSSLFFVLLLCAVPFLNKEDKFSFEVLLKKILTITVSFIVFFILINWYGFFGSFNEMLHDFVSNFWNYSNGQRLEAGNKSTTGLLYNFYRTVTNLRALMGYAIYLVPLIVYFGFKYASKEQRVKYGIILFVLLLSLFGLMKQVEFLERNLVPFYIPFLFLVGSLLSIVFHAFQKKKDFKYLKASYYIGVVIILVLYTPEIYGQKNYLFPNKISNIHKAIHRVPDLEKRNMGYININKSILDNYSNLQTNISSDIYFVKANYKEKIMTFTERLSYNDVILVDRRCDNYYQFSNFILPTYYDTNEQYGDYFVFYNKNLKVDNSQTLYKEKVVLANQLVLEQIKIKRLNSKGYELSIILEEFSNLELLKNKYIYFHAYSYKEDVKFLPSDRIEHGFENFDLSEFNISKEFGKPVIKKIFMPKLEKYESFRFGLVDIKKGKKLLKKLSIERIKL
ncbi:hypothetical protein [Flavivirga eckloniae]|uniref:Glycosyltransferase RgtA/B/C/D-like domain-containing protein n=1 Tax=Flavivirga eckloniae TaxID=1803846 RepID=A0A2K9PQP4_9FLAO|nr:hypothetical protein [Flavivirga eckloniae]AUP79381.1 hypothetical protein C1H87_11945 [Flavivirga eckloniae]